MKNKSAFGFEAAEESPGFLLWQTTVIWQRLIKRTLDAYHLSHPQFVILAVLLWFEEHQETPTQVSISRLSKLDKMSVSNSLKPLIAQGYIIREESPKDTRAKWVHLTEKGRALVTRLVPLVEGIDEKFFSAVNKKSLTQMLNQLVSGNG